MPLYCIIRNIKISSEDACGPNSFLNLMARLLGIAIIATGTLLLMQTVIHITEAYFEIPSHAIEFLSSYLDLIILHCTLSSLNSRIAIFLKEDIPTKSKRMKIRETKRDVPRVHNRGNNPSIRSSQLMEHREYV